MVSASPASITVIGSLRYLRGFCRALGIRLRDRVYSAVRAAYGMKEGEDTLAFLLRLNLELADKEASGRCIMPPGLPPSVLNRADLVSADCITAPGIG